MVKNMNMAFPGFQATTGTLAGPNFLPWTIFSSILLLFYFFPLYLSLLLVLFTFHSQSVCCSGSCLPQVPVAWGLRADLSPHSWYGCVLGAPGGLAPTGPLMKQAWPEKAYFFRHICWHFFLRNKGMKWDDAEQRRSVTSITSGMDFSGVRAPCRNRTWTSLSS